ncbi:MAG: hypothetical protein ACTS73_02660 [Arsenophonus sp. NEOnobi-MAG3]
MTYHLYDVEIIYEINYKNRLPSPKSHTSEIMITISISNPATIKKLENDREELLPFYDFQSEHERQ